MYCEEERCWWSPIAVILAGCGHEQIKSDPGAVQEGEGETLE